MKSLLKKTTAFLFVFSSLAVAAGLISKKEVNSKIAALIAPFNDQSSVMALQFRDLKVDSVRALDFALNAIVAKKGSENKLILKLQNASYHYGNGSTPTMKGDLSIQLDLAKAFGQNSLNELSDELEKVARSAAEDYSRKYGTAAKIDVGVEDLTKDTQGNFESVKAHINVTIDTNKLPENLKTEDVEFKTLNIRLAVNGQGARAKVLAVLNSRYKRFQEDQMGLKEYIEKLLSEDSVTYQEIYQGAKWINDITTDLVNKKANE